MFVREILRYLNTSVKNCYYTEDDIIDTIRDSFQEIKTCAMSNTDTRIVLVDYERVDEF